MRPVGTIQTLADRLFDGLIEIDLHSRIVLCNEATTRITGYEIARAVGVSYRQYAGHHVSENGSELPDMLIPLLMTARDGVRRDSIGYLNHADGYRLTVITRTEPLCDKRGRITGAAEIFSDNKALIAAFQAAQKTEETVLLDPLTGIGNRAHIEVKIRSAIEELRLRQKSFGVLFIDVDHFKEFNDTHGHLIGDRILRMAANTLRQNLRGSDSCGRWGGEEFIALVHDLDAAGLAKVADKLRLSISQTQLREKGLELNITVSIGASLGRPTDNLQSLLDRADQLMYESKRQGRNQVSTD